MPANHQPTERTEPTHFPPRDTVSQVEDVDGLRIVTTAISWDNYSFALIDTKGIGHDLKTCSHVADGEGTPEQRKEPWPCGYCVAVGDLRSSVSFPIPGGQSVPPNLPTDAHGRAQAVLGRLDALLA